ncbi:39S ribosomal protein S18a, mitochondrial-like [Mercenaria mercenaria]|uniref:39S ribosomal protein S18a, mitochondrial-like n=1 Tax=Mercenaria mercenaria TaxID=6596 RepID=UPI00234F291A|nr:39S ribosomal protein S18a, mitochondrial-like [Mercenaria mercenaria]
MSGTMRFISNLHKISFNLLRFQKENAMIKRRLLHSTVPLYLREVTETTVDNVTTIEGRLVESPREDYVIKADGEKHLCPLCRLNLDINYTDILIISQFVQEDGEIVPRQITGLCYPQHARMKHLIHQAHSAGLMQNLRPHVYPVEYSQMSDHAWKKYNVYYNEAIDD